MTKEEIVKFTEDELTEQIKTNVKCIAKVLSNTKDKSLAESVNSVMRTYDEALAKCVDAGAKTEDKGFMYDFTTTYTNAVLSLVANLLLVKDITKNESNIVFLKSKLEECSACIDKLKAINEK